MSRSFKSEGHIELFGGEALAVFMLKHGHLLVVVQSRDLLPFEVGSYRAEEISKFKEFDVSSFLAGVLLQVL